MVFCSTVLGTFLFVHSVSPKVEAIFCAVPSLLNKNKPEYSPVVGFRVQRHLVIAASLLESAESCQRHLNHSELYHNNILLTSMHDSILP